MDFQHVRREFQKLQIRYKVGELKAEDFQRAVNALQVEDGDGNTWQIGAQTGEWYRLEGQEWVRDVPPPTAGPPPVQARESPLPVQRFPGPSSIPSSPQVSQATPPPVQTPPVAAQPPPSPVQVPPIAAQPPLSPPTSSTAAPSAPKKRTSGWVKGCIVIVLVVACLGSLLIGAMKLVPDLLDGITFISPSEAGIQVVNNTYMDVCYVFISPSTNDDWGEDWLDDDEVIEPGGIRTFSVEVDQTVDIQALNCEQELMHAIYDIEVTEEGITYTLEPLP
jgi:hypothetical protein